MANISQSILRRIRELYDQPGASLEQLTDTLKNFNRGEVAEIRPSGAGMRKLSRDERVKQIAGGASENIGGGGMGALGVIKGKGGNWLNGTVENALSGLKKLHAPHGNPYSQEQIDFIKSNPQAAALNNWIEGALTKYVKRDMATEGDPVRKLAEQGVLHYTPDRAIPQAILELNRRAVRPKGSFTTLPSGELIEGNIPTSGPGTVQGRNPLARQWEDLTDSTVGWGKAGRMSESAVEQNPWISKLNPEEDIYQLSRGFNPNDVGFNHLTDELSNALNPESGLPRQLLLTPEQMQQMGMEKAVRHVHNINEWRAAQQAEANLAKSQSPAVHMVREYAENNPKGLRWVELKEPEAALPEGYTIHPDPNNEGYVTIVDPQGRIAMGGSSEREAIGLLNRQDRRNQLQDALKYEGDTMGHCVGGYCDDVASGKSRIFSLRDAKGEPHVTIETRPGQRGSDYAQMEDNPLGLDLEEALFGAMFDGHKDLKKWIDYGNFAHPELQAYTKQHLPEIYDKFFKPSDTQIADTIIQIKGKGNAKPKDDYLPFVQDFVRNSPAGGWSHVGDLQNTGLRRMQDAFNENERKILQAGGHELTDFMTPEQIQSLQGDTFDKALQVWREQNPQNFAEGGLVRENYKPLEFDGVRGYILQ